MYHQQFGMQFSEETVFLIHVVIGILLIYIGYYMYNRQYINNNFGMVLIIIGIFSIFVKMNVIMKGSQAQNPMIYGDSQSSQLTGM